MGRCEQGSLSKICSRSWPCVELFHAWVVMHNIDIMPLDRLMWLCACVLRSRWQNTSYTCRLNACTASCQTTISMSSRSWKCSVPCCSGSTSTAKIDCVWRPNCCSVVYGCSSSHPNNSSLKSSRSTGCFRTLTVNSSSTKPSGLCLDWIEQCFIRPLQPNTV